MPLRTLPAQVPVQIVHRDDQDRITESWFIPADQKAVDEFWS
jgi:hypothetical protein